MNTTQKSRNSTCSTDNGSSHGHEDNGLTHVMSNLSEKSSSPKQKEVDSPITFDTSDAQDGVAAQPSQTAPRNVASSSRNSKQLTAAAAVHLDTLLVTGQRKSWRFDPNDTVETVRSHIYENWPESWPQPKPDSAAYMRLLHLGHILDNPDITLASRGCKAGSVTVVHIIIRSIPPTEPAKVEQGEYSPLQIPRLNSCLTSLLTVLPFIVILNRQTLRSRAPQTHAVLSAIVGTMSRQGAAVSSAKLHLRFRFVSASSPVSCLFAIPARFAHRPYHYRMHASCISNRSSTTFLSVSKVRLSPGNSAFLLTSFHSTVLAESLRFRRPSLVFSSHVQPRSAPFVLLPPVTVPCTMVMTIDLYHFRPCPFKYSCYLESCLSM